MYTQDGALRTRDPLVTLELIKPYLSLAGVTRVADLTRLDRLGLPVYGGIRPLSKSLSGSQGKGLTHSLAKCSACMEAIEHYYAENCKADVMCYRDELDVSLIVPPEAFEHSSLVVATDQLTEIAWNTMDNVLDDRQFYVPHDVISLDLIKPRTTSCKVSSTGLASGNTDDEAFCHALFEIIERNCTREFFANSREEKNAQIIKLNTINNLLCKRLIDTLHAKKVSLILYDLMNAFEIPTFLCVIHDEQAIGDQLNFYGAGTHLSTSHAMLRAITEAVQSRLTSISGSRDDLPYDKDCYRPVAEVSDGVISYQELPYTMDSFDDIKNYLFNRFSTQGYNKVLYKSLTGTDEPFSVIKAIVPGLAI